MVQVIKCTKPTPLHPLNMQSSQNEVNVITLYSNTINDNSKCWHRVPSCLNLTFLRTILSTPKQIMAIMMMKILSIFTKKGAFMKFCYFVTVRLPLKNVTIFVPLQMQLLPNRSFRHAKQDQTTTIKSLIWTGKQCIVNSCPP